MTRLPRLSALALLALLAALALAAPARAGGWSVVVLDSGPLTEGGSISPDEPIEVGFTVLQHGKTPVSGITPTITLTPRGGGESITIFARASGGPGHYVATLTLPAAGVWEWQIEAFGPPAPMAPISVVAPAPASAGPAPVAMPAPLLWAALAAALLGALLLLARTRRPRVA